MKKKRTLDIGADDRRLLEGDAALLLAIADEGEGGFLIPSGGEKEVKEWLDCAWKRVPCGKRSCPLCGRVARDRDRLLREGKDPDSIQGVFDSVGASFAETMALMQKEAERLGIDISNLDDIKEPPEPAAFPLWVTTRAWQMRLRAFVSVEEKRGAHWLRTEAAANLTWYAGTFGAKVYRQLSNEWHIARNDGYGDFDYEYTADVLRRVIMMLMKAFADVRDLAPESLPLAEEFRALAEKVKPLLVRRAKGVRKKSSVR